MKTLKTCIRCLIEKEIENFGKLRSSKDGYRDACKNCRKNEYYNNHEKMLIEKRTDYQKHKTQRLLNCKEYYNKNREMIKNRIKNYYENNKNNPNFHRNKYRDKVNKRRKFLKQKKKEINRDNYLDLNKGIRTKLEKICENCNQNKLIFDFNFINCTTYIRRKICIICEKILVKERIKKQKQKAYIKLKSENPSAFISSRLNSRMWEVIKRYNGVCYSKTLEEAIGCSNHFLINYLKSTMDNTMTWEMFLAGKLHIDHIKPCCAFDLTDNEQLKKCFNYKNLRLLHKHDNLSKAHQDKKQSIYKKKIIQNSCN